MVRLVNLRKPFLFGALVLCLDQISKYWALTTLSPLSPVVVNDVLNWQLAHNTGISFSVFNRLSGYAYGALIASQVMMMIILLGLILYRKTTQDERYAWGLILFGALSNLIDRIWHGAVIDFIHLHWQNWHWYIFNLADVAICLGAAYLFMKTFRGQKKKG